ncbi:MAG: AI-2E family transporter [Clostridia bacterium]|nr:AI-2E family transporter [Clostridia bacterium]
MKKKFDAEFLSRILSGVIIAAAGVTAYFIFQNFSGIKTAIGTLVKVLQPFIIGFVLAFLLNLPMVFIENRLLKLASRKKKDGSEPKPPKKKLIRALSLILALLFFLLLLALFVVAIGPQLAASINGFVSNLKTYVESLNAFVSELANRFHIDSDLIARVMPSFDQLVNYVFGLLQKSVPEVVSITSQVTSTLLNIVIGLIVSIYFLASKETFVAQTKKVVYAFLKRERAERLVRVASMANRTFTGFISGKLIDSLLIGIICFVGLTAMRMPYSLLISVIVGVTNIIPFFGPVIGAIPSVMIVLLVDPRKALLLLIFIVALQQFDGNILGPRILGDSTGLPNFWVMFAIIVGGGLFGFTGMLISVPVFAVIYALLREALANRLKTRGLPFKTSDYDRPGVLREEESGETAPSSDVPEEQQNDREVEETK